MRIFAISDLHLDSTNSKPMDIFGPVWENQTEEILASAEKLGITNDDVILLAGDLSWAMKIEDVKPDLDFLNKLPGKKVLVKGNHDYWWSGLSKVKAVMPENCYVIQNNAVKIGNKVFCGTRGWDIDEGKGLSKEDKAIYDREVIRLGLSLGEAKKLASEGDEIICLMHYPPFNFSRKESDFTRLIEEAQVKKVVYGHIHNNFKGRSSVTEINGVNYYLTSCDFLHNSIIEIK